MTERVFTCQICGRIIKAKNGIIAHHGYKRPGGGWQTASCNGAKFLPYEISCDRLPPIIEKIKNFIILKENQLSEFINNPPGKLTIAAGVYQVSRPENFNSKNVTWGMAFHSYEGQFNHIRYEFEQDIKFAKMDLEFMEERLSKWVYRG